MVFTDVSEIKRTRKEESRGTKSSTETKSDGANAHTRFQCLYPRPGQILSDVVKIRNNSRRHRFHGDPLIQFSLVSLVYHKTIGLPKAYVRMVN